MAPPNPLRSRAARVLPGLLALALVLYTSLLPLRPEAWGGPRGPGPLEDRPLPAAGRLARDARLAIEQFAVARSPRDPLAATAEGLLGVHALLVAGRYLLLTWALRRAGGSDLVAVLGSLAAFVVEAVNGFPTDDSNVGLFLFAGLLVATAPGERNPVRGPMLSASEALQPAARPVSDPLRGSARPIHTPSNRTLIGLMVWFVIWANAHPSAVLGLGWLGVLALGRTVEWWRGGRGGVGRWWIALGLCAAAACANPDGPGLFVDAFTAAKNPNLAALPAWQPTDFSTRAGRPWEYLASLAVLVIVQLVSPRGFTPATLLVLLTFGVWPLIQQRGLGYWWLVLPWLIVPDLGRRFVTEGPAQPWRTLPRVVWTFAIGVALLATPWGQWVLSGEPRPGEEIVSADTPWGLAAELRAVDYAGSILCGEAQGDFLARVLDGEDRITVAMYTRPETIDRDHWEETRQALTGAPDWWDVLDRQRANLVVLDRERFKGLADRVRHSPAWRVVRDAGRLFVAERREPRRPA